MTFISRLNGSSYPFKKIVNHSNSASYPLKRSSAYRTVRAVPSKNICQPFQLSVGKNNTVLSSFHLENEERLAFVAFWKFLHSHAVSTSCWLDDTKECIQSGKCKQPDWCFSAHEEIFKAFQSSRNCFKYSEKQIGFSHGNLYNLHLLSNSSPAKTFYNRNKLEIYLTKRNSSNLYIQNVHVVDTGKHSVFCCFDWALFAKINLNIW